MLNNFTFFLIYGALGFIIFFQALRFLFNGLHLFCKFGQVFCNVFLSGSAGNAFHRSFIYSSFDIWFSFFYGSVGFFLVGLAFFITFSFAYLLVKCPTLPWL